MMALSPRSAAHIGFITGRRVRLRATKRCAWYVPQLHCPLDLRDHLTHDRRERKVFLSPIPAIAASTAHQQRSIECGPSRSPSTRPLREPATRTESIASAVP
eukprot:6503220-Prymnesium_polylepis.1